MWFRKTIIYYIFIFLTHFKKENSVFLENRLADDWVLHRVEPFFLISTEGWVSPHWPMKILLPYQKFTQLFFWYGRSLQSTNFAGVMFHTRTSNKPVYVRRTWTTTAFIWRECVPHLLYGGIHTVACMNILAGLPNRYIFVLFCEDTQI